MPGTQFPAIISLSSLNGLNGFKLDGEVTGDKSGTSVSIVGDINGDGQADLLIGAPYHTSNTGRSYVVYGGQGIGAGGVFPLSSLNGTNGFKLDGEMGGDLSGFSVSTAGDINKDGYIDLLIGARYGAANKGRSYVVFGGNNLKGINILSLSSLNGTNGFKLDGEVAGDFTGSLVEAGDINGDATSDLLIRSSDHASGTGRSYAVFGGIGIGSTGNMPLSSLNGTNGLKFDGEATSDFSGNGINAAEDVNGDGYVDLLIGAPGHNGGFPNGVGRSYMVFGGPSIGSSGLFSLNSLVGTNGFKMDGEATGDWSGTSVSSCGDINGDGYADLIIGASDHAGRIGRTYVVYGSNNTISGGLLLLSSLNGTNGYKIDGEVSLDNSGYAITGGVDLNGDGYDDIIIGAHGHNGGNLNGIGRTYAVFGGPEVGANGAIALSSLNGSNGFKIDGEMTGDVSGYSLWVGGDINGDSLDDLLIGAYGHNTSVGRSYVVFGDTTPHLWVNKLTIANSQTQVLTAQNLNATDNAPVTFNISNISQGQFELVSNPGLAITLFNQSQVLAGQIQFVHSGSGIAPYYLVQIPNAGIALTLAPQAANITFFIPQAIFGNNQLWVHQGESIVMTSSLLNVTDSYPSTQVNFTVSALQHGQFALLPLNNSVLQFTQQQLLSGQVFFMQDSSTTAPSYQMGVSDPNGVLSPASANITFYRRPTFTMNSWLMRPGDSVLLTPSLLNVTDDYPSSEVNLTISNLQHGQFTLSPANNSVSVFSKFQLESNQVYFIHDSSVFAPSYQVGLSDPYFILPPQIGNITFVFPRLINNQLSISNGQTVILSANNFKATEPTFTDSNLVFYIGSLQNGYFHTTSKNLTSFMQQNITDSAIQFTHFGNQQAPSYFVSVSDGALFTPPSLAAIQFTGAPVIVNNTVMVNSTAPVILTPADLNITVTDGSTPGQVVISISDLQNSQIVQTSNQQPVSNFTLANLQNGQIELIPDGTHNMTAPSYTVTVTSNNGVSTAPNLVDLHYSNGGIFAPLLLTNYLFIKQGDSVVLTPQNLQAGQDNRRPLNDPSALFLISGVNHGQFSLVNHSNVQISFFIQQQLQNNQVIFTQDGSRNIPGYSAAVQSQGLQSASSVAQILFESVNQPPVLMHALSDQSAVVGKPWTYEIAVDAFVDPQGDPLTLSAVLFNSSSNSSQSLPSWIQFDEVNNRFTGTPDSPGELDIGVTAQDSEGLFSRGDFALTVSQASDAALNNTIKQAIITSVVTGGIGLMFLALQLFFKRAAKKKLLAALGESTNLYDLEVVRPVAKEIAHRVKVTGFMNTTTDREMANFKGAVRTVLSELDKRGVNGRNYIDDEVKKDAFISEIGAQAQLRLVPNQGCCSWTTSFFKAQATPDDIRKAAPDIADAVVKGLGQKAGQVSMSPLSSNPQHLFSGGTPSPTDTQIKVVEEYTLHDGSSLTTTI